MEKIFLHDGRGRSPGGDSCRKYQKDVNLRRFIAKKAAVLVCAPNNANLTVLDTEYLILYHGCSPPLNGSETSSKRSAHGTHRTRGPAPCDLSKMQDTRGLAIEMTNEDKTVLALETRSNSIAGVQMARARFGLDIREAKALSFHITKVKGECHRCHTPVVEEVSVCEKCRSANLDW